MQELQDVMRENGLTSIPTIHNDKNPSGQFAMEGEGKVDLCVTVLLFLSFLSNMHFYDSYGWDGYAFEVCIL